MKVRLYDEDTSFGGKSYCTIAEFTKDDGQLQHGFETLMIMMGTQNKLKISSKPIFGIDALFTIPPLVVDKQVHIEVHQRYMYGGKYRYIIDVDGVNYASKIVTDAQQYFNIKVYSSEIHREACHVYVSDFKLTNFL